MQILDNIFHRKPSAATVVPVNNGEAAKSRKASEDLLPLFISEGVYPEVAEALEGMPAEDIKSLLELPPSEISKILGIPATKLLPNRFQTPIQHAFKKLEARQGKGEADGAGVVDSDGHITEPPTKEALIEVVEGYSMEVAQRVASNLMSVATELPIVGPVATLLSEVFTVIDNVKCNKNAARAFGTRLQQMVVLLADPQGGLLRASAAVKSHVVDSYVHRFAAKLKEARDYLAIFTKTGFLQSLLYGQQPKERFQELDKSLSGTISELGAALSLANLTISAKTYEAVTNVQGMVQGMGGWDAVQSNPGKLEELAKSLQVDVSDLTSEMSAQFAELRKSQEEIKSKLDQGPQLLIQHLGFRHLWSTYIRTMSVRFDDFVGCLTAYLEEVEHQDAGRIDSLLSDSSRLRRSLDANGNDELTPLELRQALRCHVALPTVTSVLEALVGQARRVRMPPFDRRTFGNLHIRLDLASRMCSGTGGVGGGGGMVMLNITGPEGVGKTHWALAVGADLVASATAADASSSSPSAFKGELLYQDMQDAHSPSQLLSSLASQLSLPRTDEMRTAFLALIAGLAPSSVLILDHVHKAAYDGSEGLESLLTEATSSSITCVLISRSPLLARDDHRYAISPLAHTDAVSMATALLEGHEGRTDNDSTAESVARTAQGNPGAISLLCRLPASALHAALLQQKQEPPISPTTASQHASCATLTSVIKGASTAEDRSLLARLAPLRVVDAQFPSALVSCLLGTGADDAVQRLKSLGAVVVNDEGTLRMAEGLVIDGNKASVTPDTEEEAASWDAYYDYWAKAIISINQRTSSSNDLRVSMSEFDTWRRHFEALLSCFMSSPLIVVAPPRRVEELADSLAGMTENVVHKRLPPDQLLDLFRGVSSCCSTERDIVAYTQSLADYLRWAGILGSDLDAAAEQLTQSIALLRSHPTFLTEREDVYSRFLVYGSSVYEALGRVDDAIGLREAGIEILRRDDNSSTSPQALASALDALGNAYWSKERYDLSERYSAEALVLLSPVLSQEHPSVTNFKLNLGNAKLQLKKYEEAEALYLEAAHGLTHSMGAEHPSTAKAWECVANARARMDRWAGAVEAYDQAQAALGGREWPADMARYIEHVRQRAMEG